ncbi:MAG: protein kinase [candidate division Zixibacteria bacterium]|nr:protein kinase [candidate division Zixibacteria bacterium]
MATISANLKRIANFELKNLIGSGGMANIYKGVQLSLDRPVAIKVLHQHLTANKDFVARFEQEAKQAAMLQHQNIVSIIDYGHQDDQYFIAMEFIDGQNLKEILTRIERLPLEIALLIAREVAFGLKYAHSNELVHRDIKPANIMLAKDGRVMITDFGIAKTHGDMSITVTGQTIGSPAYMSPEQAAGRPIDQRCDIFSLGIVLYEIVTGKKPFNGDNYQQVVTSVISGTPVDPSSLRVDVTSSIENLIMKALNKDIESRFQDAEEMASSLDEELSSYIIPSAKNIISGFVRNPIRTTEKLRTERISKHMETALYLVNIGHGRLTDAIKEFENVLRFDKKNKLAKEYLDRLKSGQQDFSGQSIIRKFNIPFRWIAPVGFLIFASLLFYFVFKDNIGGIFDASKRSESSPSITAESPITDNEPINFIIGESADLPMPPPNLTDSPADNPITQKKPIPGKPQKKPEVKPGSKPPAVKKAKPKQVSAYNYPNQDIAKFGLMEIISRPPATFSVDLTYYGKTGGPAAKLSPGRHLITIEAKGYRTERKRIYTETGKTESIEVELRPNN